MKLIRKIESEPFISLSESGIREHAVTTSETTPEGYEDITGLMEWFLYGEFTGADYKLVRKNIQTQAYIKTSGFTQMESLTQEELLIICEYIAVPLSVCMTVLGEDFSDFLEDWIEKSKIARLSRWEAAKSYVFNSIVESNKLLKYIADSKLISLYHEGIESVSIDGEEGLFDLVESTAGSSFENSGMLNGGYTTISGGPLSDVVSGTMDILRGGVYSLNLK